MAYHDLPYIECVKHILEHGVRKPNRTGVDTIGVFAYPMRFDLRDNTIPLLTTKKVHTKSITHELLWMMSGSTNIKYLTDNGVSIWNEWADENGELGPVYGAQWRKWLSYEKEYGVKFIHDIYIDQVAQVVDKLLNNPNDRRMIISAWNVAQLPQMKLPPCHYTFQFYAKPLTTLQRVRLATQRYHWTEILEGTSDASVEHFLNDIKTPKYELSVLLNQRSCDVGLGVPFNIVQYSFLLRMFAEVANMAPGELIWSGADVHIYVNHIEQLKEQTMRTPIASPTFRFGRSVVDIDDFKYDDFIIEGYHPHPAIQMDVAV